MSQRSAVMSQRRRKSAQRRHQGVIEGAHLVLPVAIAAAAAGTVLH